MVSQHGSGVIVFTNIHTHPQQTLLKREHQGSDVNKTFHQGPGPGLHSQGPGQGPGFECQDQDKDKDLSKCGHISVNIPGI